MVERKIPRIYTGSDGESHFDDIVISLRDRGALGKRSEPIKATGIIIGEWDAGYTIDWHTASHRQFVISLEGEGEVEVSDGTKRRFRPGDIFLAEDTMGKGHLSRGLKNQPRKVVFVTLD